MRGVPKMWNINVKLYPLFFICTALKEFVSSDEHE